jgi:hypothetical protein
MKMIKQLTTMIAFAVAIMAISGTMILLDGPSDHDAALDVAEWAQEVQEISKADIEYMRRNGAFDK